MKRFITYMFIFCGLVTTADGQQLAQFSQYLQNLYLLNPAAAGVNHQTDINLSYRQQWTGIENAPTAFYVTGSTPLGREYKRPNRKPSSTRISRPQKFEAEEEETVFRRVYHGVGGTVVRQEIGAFNKTIANLSYAIHLPVNKKLTVGLGASAGVSNHGFDPNKIAPLSGTDQAYINFMGGNNSVSVFDAGFGAIGYTEKWFLSYSIAQLLQNDLSFGENADALENGQSMHHFVSAGYRIPLDANFTLIPSGLMRFTGSLPSNFDVNLKLEYQQLFWGGISYRHQSAVVALLGTTINDKVRVGYSYDYSFSSLRSFNSGSHEIFLGLLFNKKRRIAF